MWIIIFSHIYPRISCLSVVNVFITIILTNDFNVSLLFFFYLKLYFFHKVFTLKSLKTKIVNYVCSCDKWDFMKLEFLSLRCIFQLILVWWAFFFIIIFFHFLFLLLPKRILASNFSEKLNDWKHILFMSKRRKRVKIMSSKSSFWNMSRLRACHMLSNICVIPINRFLLFGQLAHGIHVKLVSSLNSLLKLEVPLFIPWGITCIRQMKPIITLILFL